MPDVTLTPAEAQRRTQLLAQLSQALGIPTALGEGPGNGSHLAAAGSEPDGGWSAKAKAALELWEAHSETIATRARTEAWGALTAEERGAGIAALAAIQLSDRIADAVVARRPGPDQGMGRDDGRLTTKRSANRARALTVTATTGRCAHGTWTAATKSGVPEPASYSNACGYSSTPPPTSGEPWNTVSAKNGMR